MKTVFFRYKGFVRCWFNLMKQDVLRGFRGRIKYVFNYPTVGLKTGYVGGKYIRVERICLLRE